MLRRAPSRHADMQRHEAPAPAERGPAQRAGRSHESRAGPAQRARRRQESRAGPEQHAERRQESRAAETNISTLNKNALTATNLAAMWSRSELPGGDLALMECTEGALGTISISAVRLEVTSTWGEGNVWRGKFLFGAAAGARRSEVEEASAQGRVGCRGPRRRQLLLAPYVQVGGAALPRPAECVRGRPRQAGPKAKQVQHARRAARAPRSAHLVGPQVQRQLRLLEDIVEGLDELRSTRGAGRG